MGKQFLVKKRASYNNFQVITDTEKHYFTSFFFKPKFGDIVIRWGKEMCNNTNIDLKLRKNNSFKK